MRCTIVSIIKNSLDSSREDAIMVKIFYRKQIRDRAAAAALSFALFLGMVAGLAGCGSTKFSEKDDGRLKVVATVFAEYDFLRNIAGDSIHLTMLMLPGADLHTFDPTPKDIREVQEADLFVTVGGESDAWADKIVASVDSDRLQTIRLMDCVDSVVEEEIVEGMEVAPHSYKDSYGDRHGGGHEDAYGEGHGEGSHEDDGKELDEHVWTSPKNAIQIVERLCASLCRMDSKNRALYQKNTQAYIQKLKRLDAAFTEVVESGKRREIIVADRFPFRYFADAYDLEYYAAFPGCSVQTGASAETVAFLIRKVREDGIPVVFHMELSSELMCNTVCDETGAKKAQLNAVHNISKRNFDKGIGYLELMQENVEAIREALS